MMQFIKRLFSGSGIRNSEIEPDEIFIDASNLPDFDTSQFEGRLEHPIGRHVLLLCGLLFFAVGGAYTLRLWKLQIAEGAAYVDRSLNNSLQHSIIFPKRGIIYDRNGTPLAWNDAPHEGIEFQSRGYLPDAGLSHIVGYIKYPRKDSNGFYFTQAFEGVSGIENLYNADLSGVNGLKVVETDAHQNIQSEGELEPPQDGRNVTLSLDLPLQKKFYEIIENRVKESSFVGGAGVIMDVTNGEVRALVSAPDFSSEAMSLGKDTTLIEEYRTDIHKPFLNRALSGLYTPGSIVKPFIAAGVLNEHVISPTAKIVSTGSISIVNPYDKTKSSIFTDWKAHGAVDMRRALAVSSDVYFYEVGGGFENQKGLGIVNIDKYMKMFGFGEAIPDAPFFKGEKGVIPTPEWKAKVFDGDPWRLGDTYNTSIGQYGFQMTPIQAALGMSAVANRGVSYMPSIVLGEKPRVFKEIPINPEYFDIIQEGMRDGVSDEGGTATGLNTPFVKIAAKTGTAEVGAQKRFVNSWVIGFFPYEKPRYAFVVLMERGPSENQIGGVSVMRELLEWMNVNDQEYFEK